MKSHRDVHAITATDELLVHVVDRLDTLAEEMRGLRADLSRKAEAGTKGKADPTSPGSARIQVDEPAQVPVDESAAAKVTPKKAPTTAAPAKAATQPNTARRRS